MGKIHWAIPVCILFALVTLGVATYTFFRSRLRADPPVDSSTISVRPAPDSQSSPSTSTPAPDEKPNALANAKPPTTPSSRPGIRRWTMPATIKLEGEAKHEFDVIQLVVNDTGTRALARSVREVNYVNLQTGKILKTYRPAKPRWDTHTPNSHFMFLSPDMRFVAVGVQSPSTVHPDVDNVTIFETVTGNAIGTYTIINDTDLYQFTDTGTYSANSDYLLLPGHIYSEFIVQAVSTRTGQGRIVNIPNAKKIETQLRLLLPVPQEAVFILFHDRVKPEYNPSGVTALDLQTGKEKPISAITIQPFASSYQHGLQLSPDGKLLLAQSKGAIQVCNWRSNRLVCEVPAERTSFSLAHFTPDGKRFVFMRYPQYNLLHTGGTAAPYVEELPPTLELYDIARRDVIGTFTPVHRDLGRWITALAVSGDGKTIVLASERQVYAVDFQYAFGLEPLAPVARSHQPDVLPLK